MVLWVFGYGSLIWKPGFQYDQKLFGFIKGYRRLFYQGSTDHRGTPEYPGRTVTLEPADGHVCWGVAYRISGEEEQTAFTPFYLVVDHLNLVHSIILDHFCIGFLPGPIPVSSFMAIIRRRGPSLEVREKQYDNKAYLDFYTDLSTVNPAVSGVLVYIGSPNKTINNNYLGPASIEEMALQIYNAQGPSGPNKDYLFELENALLLMGCEDKHVMDLANSVRKLVSESRIRS